MLSSSDLEASIDSWLARNAPPSLVGTRGAGAFDGFWGGKRAADPGEDRRRWLEVCAAEGLTAPTWPREYGGAGLSEAQARVFQNRLAALRLPPPLVGFGLVMLGPVLLQFGTERQKATHLPAICRGEIRWCQGYSEPGAGSDLASLQTRAVQDGDQFIVHGQKVWTSHADLSDWIFCLVRTDPHAKKQAGITFLLIDMESPGVTARRIPLISGQSPFCEVFLEGVRVPIENAVHQVNGGWTVAKALLQHERSVIGAAISDQMAGSESSLVNSARYHMNSPTGPLPDPRIRDRIAQLAMDETAFQLTLARIHQEMAGGQPGLESSILKVAGSDLKQARYDLAVRIAGPEGIGWEGEGFLPEDLMATREWLRSRANSIEGGTSEIQLNIIARRVLGLPESS